MGSFDSRSGWLWAGLLLALGSPVLPDAACSTAGCGEGTCGSSWEHLDDLIVSSDFPEEAQRPVAFVDPADGLPHRFIATQAGKIWVWSGSSGTIRSAPFLDLSDRVAFNFSERGLLALAVDPDYAETGHLYVLYTGEADAPGADGDVVIERYTRSAADPELADPDSGHRILVVPHPDENHNGGWLAFGPDGMLYASFGDGGGHCDDDIDNEPRTPNGQNLATLLGKLLRLDVRGVDPAATSPECDAGGDYAIPLGNPFAGETPGCGEIWAYGLRNPFRFSFDRTTGDLWLGDVGQRDWEEVNYIAADYYPLAPSGAINFGWRCREGCETLTCPLGDCPGFLVDTEAPSTCTYPNDVDPGAGTHYYWDPVLCHKNGGGEAGARWQSVIGGYRYRGGRVSSLAGQYLYSDAYCDQLWRSTSIVEGEPAATTSACLHAFTSGGGAFLYSFAEDRLGELYLIFGDGTIRCLHGGDGCYWAGWTGIFQDGFESVSILATRWSHAQGEL